MAGRPLEADQSRLSRFTPVLVTVLAGQCIRFAFLPLGSFGPGRATPPFRPVGSHVAGVSYGPIAAVMARRSSGATLPRMSGYSIGTGESRNTSRAHVSFRSCDAGRAPLALVAFAALQSWESLEPWGPIVALGAYWPWLAPPSFLGVALAAPAAVSPSAGHVKLLHTREDALGQEPHGHGPQQQPPPQGSAGRRAPVSVHAPKPAAPGCGRSRLVSRAAARPEAPGPRSVVGPRAVRGDRVAPRRPRVRSAEPWRPGARRHNPRAARSRRLLPAPQGPPL